MLSLIHLQLLSLPERARYIQDYCNFVESRTEGDFGSNLYRMNDYYAEVIYNNAAGKVEDVVLKESLDKY
jgi:hypothetical protein